MFLFTNAPVGTRETGPAAVSARPANAASGEVIAAIRDGAQSSGVGFDYLLATAQRESSLNPTAKAGTSTATGLFQFIEQTWLGVMKNAGAKLGLGTYADAITARPDGTYTVADPATRQAILDLRRDPKVSATMAGALTQRNRDALGTALGREPTSGDLYAAHVLGARGATTLINSAQGSPARAAALDLPEAAAANRSLFYDKAGRPRSSSELYALLSTATSGAPTPVATAAGTAEPPMAYASLDGGLRSLFQTDRRQGAISEGVAKIWQGRNAGAAAARPAPTYFPRSDAAEDVVQTAAIPDAADPVVSSPILVPLPPRRPAGLGQAATTTASAEPNPAALPSKTVFFDLSSYNLRNGP
ncbi:transglycosylase SLT domain-containing protein [Methylorubrum salsuginis]|uniref:Transglycosylase SLT domain-containing protein n=1 Tax=Methylorubrum salsuginis TaxID=414703 RepID=A0A1I3ZSH2_9HYPH|nr:transglycosylase SLT domain-containing protein [Methylorubrum salsuginis]SFK46509.1 Transglycosylase SLT domain-containing protein [Methylorubrum salsuginis]